MGATRLYCMIALILAARRSFAGDGLHRPAAQSRRGHRAMNLSPFALILLLMVFYIVLGCFLDGISMVVLTMAVLLPTLQTAASTAVVRHLHRDRRRDGADHAAGGLQPVRPAGMTATRSTTSPAPPSPTS